MKRNLLTFARAASRIILILVASSISETAFAQSGGGPVAPKTVFQTGQPWNEAYDLRSDAAIVYGVYNKFHGRVDSWREHGYAVQFMTGIAWGNYQDYFLGKFDGKRHMGDGQVDSAGNVIWHGKDVPYVVPSQPYLKYIESIIREVIDEGITTIYLEEPEFWARSGYSDAFKREWTKYYGTPWEPQYKSADATYLSSKLKFHLYYEALREVLHYAKAYGRGKGKEIKCFVATHSLLNYSSWEIVSPEASLASIPDIDGYIAQVWSNTAQAPNYYNGVLKSRTFETAFLEYGAMESMTAPTHRMMYFLSDPVGDAVSTWSSYRKSYEQTFTAELMYPKVNRFEVMPWPERIYLGKYKLSDSKETERIPPSFATQIQVMVNSLNQMPKGRSGAGGAEGVAVLLGNSLMFQRFPTHGGYSDPNLSNFYGLALPLLLRGIPLKLVNMENLGYPATLQKVRVLLMSYASMKPLSPEVHRYLAAWVKKGGVLIYFGRDDDPFQKVTEWWDTGRNHYAVPSEHLFNLMGIKLEASRIGYKVGRGKVYVIREDPKEFVLRRDGDTSFVDLVKHAYETDARAGKMTVKNYFHLRRGAYDIAAVMKESVDTSSLTIKGPVIDLFDPTLPVLTEKVVRPGEEALLLNVGRITNRDLPRVLCGASRVYDEVVRKSSYAFLTKGPSGTHDVMRVMLPNRPTSVNVVGGEGGVLIDESHQWDSKSGTLLLQFGNSPAGVRVRLTW